MRGKWKISVALGLLLIAAALSLTLYNVSESRRAGNAAANVVSSLREKIGSSELAPGAPASSPDVPQSPEHIGEVSREMPCITIDGLDYIGYIEFPSLGLTLPVLSEWSLDTLALAPARYKGSAYLDDLIIFAHNYTSHFGRLGRLGVGDEIIFTDADGNIFRYAVTELETIAMSDVEAMTDGEWDLTLFTCTMSGTSRFTVRCERVEK